MKPTINSRPWVLNKTPKKILVMRFQALGDTIITLPYVNCIRQNMPDATIHFLTREEVVEIPRGIQLFDRVFSLGGGRNTKLQFIFCLIYLPFLLLQRYDVVIDLQNHWMSRMIRKVIAATAWSEFDKSSPISAGKRTEQTIQAIGFPFKIKMHTEFEFRANDATDDLLKKNGWDAKRHLVVLNPAGNFLSRNWKTENYIQLARLWLETVNPETQFVLMLTVQHFSKADQIKAVLGKNCINLSGKTTQLDAFLVLKRARFMLSEDSGLMHMAWVQGIPTLALFGSSRKDWSAPLGESSYCLDSSDLECGPCMLQECKYGNNHCLERYGIDHVLTKVKELLKSPGLTPRP